MRLENYSSDELKKSILRIIEKYPDIAGYHLFFFGSRVEKPTGDPHADIDIGIEGPHAIPDSTYYAIKEDLENLPILYKIDVVDFKKVTPEFYKNAKQFTENINKI